MIFLRTTKQSVAFYKCPKEGCVDLVEENFVCITDDLKHDAAAVDEMSKTPNQLMTEKRGLEIEKEVTFTNVCAAQYKSCLPFFHLSKSEVEHGFSIKRSYFGSHHGKLPADGLAAVVETATDRHFKGSGDIIQNSGLLLNLY